jgi:hypothetical protein
MRARRSLGVRAGRAVGLSHPARPSAMRVRWRGASSSEEGEKVGDGEWGVRLTSRPHSSAKESKREGALAGWAAVPRGLLGRLS